MISSVAVALHNCNKELQLLLVAVWPVGHSGKIPGIFLSVLASHELGEVNIRLSNSQEMYASCVSSNVPA
jgi:hypothetical protein